MKFLKKILNATEIVAKEYTVLYYNEDGKSINVKVSKCTVSFKDYDGSVISSKEYTYGETVIVPQFEGTWADHTFIGWGDVTIDTAKGDVVYIAQYEVTPKVAITMDDTYTDTAAIALNATKSETVTGVISFTTDLASDVADITDNVITFKKHYEGSITVTASAEGIHGIVTDTKTITVNCEVGVITVCTISDVSTPTVKCTATSATVTYKCNITTTHGTQQETVIANKEQVVTFSANEGEDPRNIEGSFECEHGETVEYTVIQKGTKIVYEAVDLGRSVLWASSNVGASSPEEYGYHFQWGDTVDYDGITPYKFKKDGKLTKYCNSWSFGTKDDKRVLDPEDDAAHVNMGGNWRMPTQTEMQSLLGCSSVWTIENGVCGRRFTSSGNSIFIPANMKNSSGFLWTSNVFYDTTDPYPIEAICAFFTASIGILSNERYSAYGVRGVMPKA